MTTKLPRDAIIFMSGARSLGKSTLGAKILSKVGGFRGEPLNLRRDIYYTDLTNSFIKGSENFNYVLGKYTQRKIMIDEGYFSGLNLDTNNPKVRKLGADINAHRNRQHVVIINFTALKRAAKILLESANVWIHKPSQDYAIVLVKQNEFVGDDAWAADQLFKAKTTSQIRYYLKHNPYYVTTIKTTPMSAYNYGRYEALKREAQEYRAERESYQNEAEEVNIAIIRQLYTDYEEGHVNPVDAVHYITKKYNQPLAYAKKYAKRLNDYIVLQNTKKDMEKQKIYANPNREEDE